MNKLALHWSSASYEREFKNNLRPTFENGTNSVDWENMCSPFFPFPRDPVTVEVCKEAVNIVRSHRVAIPFIRIEFD